MNETLTGLLQERARKWPERKPFSALSASGDEDGITFTQLDLRARSIASWLSTAADRGARVLLVFPTGKEFATAFFGCMYAGLIPVAVPPPVPGAMGERFDAVSKDCSPELVLTSAEWAPLLSAVSLPVQAVDSLEDVSGADVTEALPEDIAYLQYTSGTTGPPRGAIITHGQAYTGLRITSEEYPSYPEDRLVGWLPVFHDLGLLTNVLRPMYDGRQILVIQPTDFMRDPGGWLREVAARKVRAGSLPGFGLDTLIRRTPSVETLDLALWEYVAVGAEVLDPATMRSFSEKFRPAGLQTIALSPVYGMAEVLGMVCGTRPKEEYAVLPASRAGLSEGVVRPAEPGTSPVLMVGCGRPPAEAIIRIVDKDGLAELPGGRIGEILVAGPHVTHGYWDTPDATVPVAGRRFIRTGDLAAIVDDELYVVGRVADLIELDGGYAYPFDIERVVAGAHPAVRARGCAAFGVEGGIAVAVEVNDGADPKDLHDRVIEALTAEFGPRVRDVIPATRNTLPRTTSGKQRRNATRDRYLTGRLSRAEVSR